MGGGRAPTSPNNKSMTKARPPVGTNKKVATTNKIRKVQQHKKTTTNSRTNFKSPTAVRKAPLIASQQKYNRLHNNVSASRASRRSREERKAIVNKQKNNKFTSPKGKADNDRFKHLDRFGENVDLTNTLTSELQETECPMPSPIPERFSQASKEHGFGEFNHQLDTDDDRPDLDEMQGMDEAECEFNDEGDSVINKLPTERQSITNSKVFSMSETEFQRFDASNDTGDYLEISNEDDTPPNIDDMNRETFS